MNDLKLGTAGLTDDEFLALFESCQLPGDRFHHADHLRLSRVYIDRFGDKEAEARLVVGIRKMAQHLGVPDKFHFTMTVAWVRVISTRRKSDDMDTPFSDWIAAHPALLRQDLLQQHYSKSVLESKAARTSWVEPDLRPIGEHT